MSTPDKPMVNDPAVHTVQAVAIILATMASDNFDRVDVGVALAWLGDRLDEAGLLLLNGGVVP